MNSNVQDDTIDLKELFFSLIAEWKIISLCVLLSLVSAFIYLRTTENVYQTDALAQIKSNTSSPLAGLSSDMAAMASLAGLGGMGNSSTQGEIELLKSRAILGQAIKDLNLDIQIQPKENFFQKIISDNNYIKTYTTQDILLKKEGQRLVIAQFQVPKFYENKALLLTLEDNKYTIHDYKTEQLLKEGELNRVLRDGSWNISISGNLNSGQKFILQKNSLPIAMSNILKNFDAQEKGKGTGILELTYQGENPENIPNLLNTVLNIYKQQDISRSVTDKDQQVAFLEKQLPELKEDLNNSERQFNQFRQKYGTVDVKGESELYLKQGMELDIQKVQLQQKQAELGAQYTAEHPAMQAINAQLTTLNTKISEVNNKVKQLPEIQRLYLQYYRDVEIKNQLYTGLLTTYQSLNVAKAGELGKVSIVDYAVEPVNPIKPRKLIFLVFSILIGGFIGVLIALVRNFLHSGIRNIEPITTKHTLRNLGKVNQHNSLNRDSKQYAHPLAVLEPSALPIEQMRKIATSIQHSAQISGQPAVQMIGTTRNIGTSTLTANLAIILAQMNLKVVLIDSDLRKGQLKDYFNIETSVGLSDYLNGTAVLSSIITPTQQAKLDLIASGKGEINPVSLLSKPEMAILLDQLKNTYDFILVDGTPVLDVSDSQILANHINTNILVTRYNYTSEQEIEMALESFKNSGHSVHGIILNRVKNNF
ncbi:polysaccharide biosynthesis tyrosine autokinase [Acinetobacter lwoffii]|uniref:polysaccharide biosynthesis tyrosine autokinase n=1 Tax=Acinetobacter lwoffii TaxID=28090 RepID=UPI00209AD64D|nr:polysaccharide biosynthesis tyrosine autokinase [Acinetobacter lwoffii]MCO8074274.1 polysaccharide biosynthesis tyrosine autokinase [Acinetobacter lwoffii]MCO8077243.1 polysaccharide biosynthesis tyrosine autokinase [Acinetobacter lwoffii]